jgi:dTDP-4-amino-4,6-dideoxy-D-galactose acyltransferase
VATEPCELLPWDTEHFGVRVARVRTRRLDADGLDRILAWAAAHEVACLYLLADAQDSATWRLAASRGFRFVDLRMTLRRRLGRGKESPSGRDVGVRAARPGDEAALVEMARAGHVDSRFYADGRFDLRAVEALYERWLRGSLDGVLADAVLVAEASGVPAGYVTVRLDHEHGTGRIELLGVSRRWRSAGLGRSLVLAALDRFRDAGLEATSVVTQGRNVAGQRLYQACGFRTQLVELWYHRWSEETQHEPAA